MLSLIVISLLSFVAAQTIEEGAQHRVLGGTIISITEVPFRVSIRLISYNDEKFGFVCGGSLISEDVVLTAAHCLYKDFKLYTNRELKVFSNSSTLSVAGGLCSAVSSLKVHELYKPGCSFSHDIALLKLERKFKDAKFINLPPNTYELNEMVYITGWGAISNNTRDNVSLDLRIGNITNYSKIKCIGSPCLKNFFQARDALCAGKDDGTVDACQGDSGGPLFYNNTLYEITSYGIGCATPECPGVYTDVFYYCDWILNNTNIHCID